MNIHAARKYVSPRTRPLTPDEQETRRLSYSLKDWTSDHFTEDAFTAAHEMAQLITAPCWLVPVPSSIGSTAANRKLAEAIVYYLPTAKIMDILTRAAPVASSCQRHRTAKGPLAVADHHIRRKPGKWIPMHEGERLYFVDNTTTSGNTLAACRLAIGTGDGLVFSDARLPLFTF
ncbi:MAG TPA: hypothetical protein PKD54_04315 [Pirellulaceae bacterium]|nr:hypothetical protein [Pirellulaceae bacterium]